MWGAGPIHLSAFSILPHGVTVTDVLEFKISSESSSLKSENFLSSL